MLQMLQSQWKILVQVGVWIGGIVAAFWVMPPDLQKGNGAFTIAFAKFVLIVVAAPLLVAANRFSGRKHTLPWLFSTILFLIGSIAAYFCNQYLIKEWMWNYKGELVVIGGDEHYTSIARDYRISQPHLTKEELIYHYAGDTCQIWNEKVIQDRRFYLQLCYVLGFPLFAATIISAVQLYSCGTRPKEGS